MASRLRYPVPPLLAATLGPLLLFVLLERFPAWNPILRVPIHHFYAISMTFLLTGLLAAAVAWAGRRLRNLQVVLLALAFVSLAVFLAVHGWTTPGVLHHGNVLFTLSVHGALLTGNLFLWLSSLPSDIRLMGWIERRQVVLVFGWITLLAGYACVALLAPERFEPVTLAAPPASWLLTAAGALLAGDATYRFLQGYRYARLPLQGALAFTAAWLGTAHGMAAFSEMWRASWWLYHGLLLAAAATVTWGLLRQFTRGGSLSGALQGLFLSDPLERLRHGLSGGVAELVAATERHDPHTAGHTYRVARLAVRLGEEMGLQPEHLRALAQGAMLHDIGKIRVPREVLNKPGPLSEAEYQLVQQHPEHGYQIARLLGTLSDELDVIRYHHERWDGRGYPKGLKGEQIPLLARILSVADVYDALTSARPYREAWPEDQALAYIRAEAGKQFDPSCVAAWERLHARQRNELLAILAAAPECGKA
ncbi:MAG TPA: HD-GYP domain-containing protein [Bacillota bacterium]